MTAKFGEMQAKIHGFKLGGFEIATIMDSKSVRDALHPNFGGNAAAVEVHALARANNIDTNRFEHPYTPVLINTGKELVLIDAGNGALGREYPQLRARLPDGELVALLDHIGIQTRTTSTWWCSRTATPTISAAWSRAGSLCLPRRAMCSAPPNSISGSAAKTCARRASSIANCSRKICVPLAERSTFIKPGEEVVPGIRAVDAAGHSPGLLAFHIESEGKRFMVTADTMTQYVMAVQRPDWFFDMDDDKDKAVASRKRILDMLATDRVFFASFHFPFPGIGWVDKRPGDYRFVPHSYQLNL